MHKNCWYELQVILSDGSYCNRSCNNKLNRIDIEPQHAQISKIELGSYKQNGLWGSLKLYSTTGALALHVGWDEADPDSCVTQTEYLASDERILGYRSAVVVEGYADH